MSRATNFVPCPKGRIPVAGREGAKFSFLSPPAMEQEKNRRSVPFPYCFPIDRKGDYENVHYCPAAGTFFRNVITTLTHMPVGLCSPIIKYSSSISIVVSR